MSDKVAIRANIGRIHAPWSRAIAYGFAHITPPASLRSAPSPSRGGRAPSLPISSPSMGEVARRAGGGASGRLPLSFRPSCRPCCVSRSQRSSSPSALATFQFGLMRGTVHCQRLFALLDVAARDRHGIVLPRQLDLEDHQVLPAEGRFRAGEVEVPHAAEPLVVDLLRLARGWRGSARASASASRHSAAAGSRCR